MCPNYLPRAQESGGIGHARGGEGGITQFLHGDFYIHFYEKCLIFCFGLIFAVVP